MVELRGIEPLTSRMPLPWSPDSAKTRDLAGTYHGSVLASRVPSCFETQGLGRVGALAEG